MRASDKVLAVVAEWVQKAESDFQSASHLVNVKRRCPTDSVCFHVQQCIEKYAKALLVMSGTDFPKTHDLSVIVGLLPAHMKPALTPEDQRRLTRYATITRYPGGYPPVSREEARLAVATMRRVRKDMRKLLPRRCGGASSGQYSLF